MNDLHSKKPIIKINSKKIVALFILLLLFSFLNVEGTECPKERPILISGECKLEYCSEEQFNLKHCILNNTIIKTKWINNLIIFAQYPYRYLGFGSYSNGDFVIESMCNIEQQKRKFYGIKSNGRPFFTNKTNNEETSFYLKNINEENQENRQFKSTIIKLSGNENNGKEYFLSLSHNLGNAELYDFENDEVYYKTISDFTTLTNVISLRHTFFELSSSNSQYYYIFGFISYHNSQNKVYLQKHIFNDLNSFKTTNSFVNEGIDEADPYGKEISCFLTDKGLINCFALLICEEKLYYYFIKYENDFTNRKELRISSTINDKNTFYKCIHLKEEVGAYAYYYNSSNIYNPIILFREFDISENKFIYYRLGSEYPAAGIILQKYNFLNNLMLSDIIKITENRIAFTSVGVDKEILCVTLINLYEINSIVECKVRYYLVKLYEMYHYKIFSDIKLNNYNNILTLGFSFCNNEICSSDSDEYYSGLILFGFPNSTDTDFYLDKYLFEKNINFSDIEIDLKNQLNIENNIFGYILSSISINDVLNCGEYKLYSSEFENNEIIQNYSLMPDEKIKIKYTGQETYYPILNCKIEYFFIATEPEIDIYNNYTDESEYEDENDLFEKLFYHGRLTYFYLKINNDLSSLCDANCDLCVKETSSCIVCKYNYSSYKENGESNKKCYYENGINTNEVTYIEDKNSCSDEDIINNRCLNGFVSEEQINELYEKIKDYYYMKKFYNKNDTTNTIIRTENVIFQISKLEDQYYSDDDISSVYLGECEERLKFHCQITNDSLIIYKIDIKTSDMSHTYVQYEIYDPKNFTLLNLSKCDDLKISINIPVSLDNYTSSLYDSLKDSGYNLFNQNDSFYNDICSTYTTENNTDITLNDRKQIIYSQFANIYLCQNGCETKSYNSSSRKIMCSCPPQKNNMEAKLISSNDKFIIEEIPDSFLETIKNVNFIVLKCYKLLFDIKDFGKNLGRIFMTIIIIISFAFLLVFCFCNYKKIYCYIRIASNYEFKLIQSNNKVNERKKKRKKRRLKLMKYKPNNNLDDLVDKDIQINKEKYEPRKRHKAKSPKLLKSIYNLTSKSILDREDMFPKIYFKNEVNNHHPNINMININNLNIGDGVKKRKKLKSRKKIFRHRHKSKSKRRNNIQNQSDLNDQELNSLLYEEAILLDKRTYFEYYCSLLRTKHLILFTFYINNDYNLFSLKICLFLLSFSLYFILNGFFFNEDNIHKIYIDNGIFNVINQIPQIMYSSVIAGLLNMLLKALSLSENAILKIKKEKNFIRMIGLMLDVKKYLLLKFILFFILNYLLLLFFWYFLTCFCAVYTNTQKILFEDTLMSFGLSMLYPFGLNLLPGFFRIPALKAEKKDKISLYKISKFIALI